MRKSASILAFLFCLPLLLPAQENRDERASPPAMTRSRIASGATIRIRFSQPSLKGRTMGVDVEPMKGKVWRAGANEATEFTVDKDILVEDRLLKAGQYALFMIAGEREWTIIFNKEYSQWGAFNYHESEDALRVKVLPGKTPYKVERLTYLINREGKVSLWWGDTAVTFRVQ